MAKILNLTTIVTTETDYNGVAFNENGEYLALVNGNIIIKKMHSTDITVVCKLADLADFKTAINSFVTLYDDDDIVQE